MGAIGLFFTVKSLRTAKGTEEKGFCGMGKIENSFEKSVALRKNCCVAYISLSFDAMSRIYPESHVFRMYEQIQKILLQNFGVAVNGDIALYGKHNFVALNDLEAEAATLPMEASFEEIGEVLVKYKAVNIVCVHFGYHCTSSGEVSFKTALGRAKQACSMAADQEELYCLWDNANGKQFEKKLQMENSIQNEIENNRFFLEYQPIIEAKTEKIIGAEVLSRLNSTTEGIITPRTFLSAVNNVGLNEKFDYYIFEKNCKWISNDKEVRSRYMFTINFSRFTLCNESFAENIMRIVEQYGCDYSSIALEILEDKSLTKEEISTMTQNLKRLKEKGVLILLDDFGKGYTTFGDLASFDINIVKIDKSITQNALTQTGFVILKNIINTAHDLGLKTLCEGIETNEHKEAVITAGCDLLQGHFFYRPMSVLKLETLFER